MKHLTGREAWPSGIPADLLAVTGYAVAAGLAIPGTVGPLRVAVALPLVLFVPGYALLAALFPRRSTAAAGGTRQASLTPVDVRTPTWGERLALAVPTSLVLASLLALATATFTPGVTVPEAVGSLVGFTLVAAVVGGVRRLRLPAGERLTSPWRHTTAFRDAVLGGSRVDAILTVALVAGVVLAASAMAYAVAAPDRGAEYTEFALLSGNDTDEAVTGDFDTSFAPGERRQFIASVTNHEGASVEYTLVVELQRVRTEGDVAVVEERELLRTSRTVQPGDSWRPRHAVEPSLTGEDLRLAYYLYRDDAPANADPDSAYRRLHLWVDVGVDANATAAT